MRPIFRGFIHQLAFYIAIIACSFLIYHSKGYSAICANLIYSISLVGLYGISALYHCHTWSLHRYHLLKRIDHAAIFTLIAGTATPICALGVRGELGAKLLTLMWSFALIGMVVTLVWIHSPKWLRAALYVTAGWLALPYLSQLESALGMADFKLLAIGGLIYTMGASVYAMKRPNPFPLVFGYHEIFHVFVVLASGFHFYVIYNLTGANLNRV